VWASSRCRRRSAFFPTAPLLLTAQNIPAGGPQPRLRMTLAGIDDAGGRVGSVMVLPDNGSSTKSQSKTTNDDRRTATTTRDGCPECEALEAVCETVRRGATR
jgi:hypothetical protein